MARGVCSLKGRMLETALPEIQISSSRSRLVVCTNIIASVGPSHKVQRAGISRGSFCIALARCGNCTFIVEESQV